MPHPLKKFFVRTLIVLLGAARLFGKILAAIFRVLSLPLVWLWKLGLRKIVFLCYRLLLRAKIATGTLVAPMRKTLLALFAHRYVVHGAMVLVVLFVATKNLYARESELGQNSKNALLYSLNLFPTDEEFDESAGTDEGVLNEPFDLLGSASGTDQILTYDKSGVLSPVHGGAPEEERIMISKPEKYVVQSGDTISGIAQKYGVSINTLLWANSMTARSLIRIGQELTVLPVTGVLHTVKKGETIGAIAKRYGSDTDKILQANRVASADEIKVGDQLIVPDGKPPAPPPAPVTSRIGSAINALRSPSEAPPGKAAIAGQLVWPTDSKRINQYFKWRHAGLDINGKLDNAVYAVDDGIVTSSGWNKSGYGNMILIDHGNGVITRYAHHSKLFVKAGDQVTKGQTIGMVGSTGRSTGPHLHFEIYVNGKRRNPLEFY
jgi:murein DD-endopeptidase MepM/ murein hydrolase activator NlpD